MLIGVAHRVFSIDTGTMIIVVEGISASGKTTWCGRHGNGHVVPENRPSSGSPDRDADPSGAASYWAARNVARWQAALALEKTASPVVCDTDPLKLHYVWCSWQLGSATEADWLLELAATRDTVRRGSIGFADLYLVAEIEPKTVQSRAANDFGRLRRNFDLHRRMQPALIAWYRAIDAVLPGRVHFGLPTTIPSLHANGSRYDPNVFDRMIEALPRP